MRDSRQVSEKTKDSVLVKICDKKGNKLGKMESDGSGKIWSILKDQGRFIIGSVIGPLYEMKNRALKKKMERKRILSKG